MRKAISVILVALLIASPVVALDFEEMSFSDDGVMVYAGASADVPWEAPFSEDVTVWVSVWPSLDNVTWTRITSIIVTVHSAEPDGSDFSLIASDDYDFSTYPEGGNHVNSSVLVTLTSGNIGSHCFFSISVIGQYGNATDTFSFTASSAENLLGPFSISLSPTSPQFLIGLLMIIVFALVLALGIWGVRHIRESPKREALLKE
ncbi:MAG: hypothetical protein ACXAEE_10480 [Candidatus Thorarchaeota archaeon]|jgi:hypothetical protein